MNYRKNFIKRKQFYKLFKSNILLLKKLRLPFFNLEWKSMKEKNVNLTKRYFFFKKL